MEITISLSNKFKVFNSEPGQTGLNLIGTWLVVLYQLHQTVIRTQLVLDKDPYNGFDEYFTTTLYDRCQVFPFNRLPTTLSFTSSSYHVQTGSESNVWNSLLNEVVIFTCSLVHRDPRKRSVEFWYPYVGWTFISVVSFPSLLISPLFLSLSISLFHTPFCLFLSLFFFGNKYTNLGIYFGTDFGLDNLKSIYTQLCNEETKSDKYKPKTNERWFSIDWLCLVLWIWFVFLIYGSTYSIRVV